VVSQGPINYRSGHTREGVTAVHRARCYPSSQAHCGYSTAIEPESVAGVYWHSLNKGRPVSRAETASAQAYAASLRLHLKRPHVAHRAAAT